MCESQDLRMMRHLAPKAKTKQSTSDRVNIFAYSANFWFWWLRWLWSAGGRSAVVGLLGLKEMNEWTNICLLVSVSVSSLAWLDGDGILVVCWMSCLRLYEDSRWMRRIARYGDDHHDDEVDAWGWGMSIAHCRTKMTLCCLLLVLLWEIRQNSQNSSEDISMV